MVEIDKSSLSLHLFPKQLIPESVVEEMIIATMGGGDGKFGDQHRDIFPAWWLWLADHDGQLDWS